MREQIWALSFFDIPHWQKCNPLLRAAIKYDLQFLMIFVNLNMILL